MAYLPENDPNAMAGGPVQRGGGGTFGSGGGGGSSQKPTQSGMFTNLQGYLNANQGQGAAMVDRATTGVQGDYNTAVNLANNLADYSPTIKGREAFGEGESGFNQYASYLDSLNNAQAPNILGATTSQLGNVTSAANQMAGSASNAGSWAASNTPSKTGGGNLLNSAIASGDPSTRARMGTLQKDWSGLSGYLSGKQNTVDANAKNYNDALSGAKGWVARQRAIAAGTAQPGPGTGNRDPYNDTPGPSMRPITFNPGY